MPSLRVVLQCRQESRALGWPPAMQMGNPAVPGELQLIHQQVEGAEAHHQEDSQAEKPLCAGQREPYRL